MRSSINNLKPGQSIQFTYLCVVYKLSTFVIYSNGERGMSVVPQTGMYSTSTGMNVSKITKKYIKLYDYTMLGEKIKSKMSYSDITEWKIIGRGQTSPSPIDTFTTDMEDILESGILGGTGDLKRKYECI